MKKLIARFLTVIGFLSILFTIIVVFAISTIRDKKTPLQDKIVLYVDFSLPISENPQHAIGFGLGPHQVSLRDLTEAINYAAVDYRVVGIIARIDETKLNLSQIEEVRKAVTMFRADSFEKRKFSIAHSYGFGASGPSLLGYYLASSFGEIHMQPMGNLYLSGINIELPYARQFLDEHKVKPDFHRREEYKSALDFAVNKSMSKEEKDSWTAVLHSQLNTIISDIATAREKSTEEIKQVIDDSPVLGSNAVKLGLIDRLSYFDEIKDKIKKQYGEKIPFVSIEKYIPHVNFMTDNSKIIALIYGVGEIIQKSDIHPFMDDRRLSALHVAKAIEKASENPKVKAIVLRIDSPGGSPEASETVARAIKIAQNSGKPVVVSMGSVAASGGYWIAAGADAIFADASTITGSIGVITGKFVTQEAWKKFGINWESISIGKNAKMWSSSSEFDENAKKKLNEQLDFIYRQFVERVAKGRNMPIKKASEIAKGRIWTGEQALKHGLVDHLGGLNEAIEYAKVEYKIALPTVVVMPTPKPPFMFVLEELSGNSNDEVYGKMNFGQLFAREMISGFMSTFGQYIDAGKTQTVKLDVPQS